VELIIGDFLNEQFDTFRYEESIDTAEAELRQRQRQIDYPSGSLGEPLERLGTDLEGCLGEFRVIDHPRSQSTIDNTVGSYQ